MISLLYIGLNIRIPLFDALILSYSELEDETNPAVRVPLHTHFYFNMRITHTATSIIFFSSSRFQNRVSTTWRSARRWRGGRAARAACRPTRTRRATRSSRSTISICKKWSVRSTRISTFNCPTHALLQLSTLFLAHALTSISVCSLPHIRTCTRVGGSARAGPLIYFLLAIYRHKNKLALNKTNFFNRNLTVFE